jgi:hypothetical protein
MALENTCPKYRVSLQIEHREAIAFSVFRAGLLLALNNRSQFYSPILKIPTTVDLIAAKNQGSRPAPQGN